MENLRIVIKPYWKTRYEAALRERGIAEWPLLKEKLIGPNSYQALFYLEQYMMARKAGEIAYRAYHAEDLTDEERILLRDEYWEVVGHRFKLLDRLFNL